MKAPSLSCYLRGLLVLLPLLGGLTRAAAQAPAAGQPLRWITLGTNGGPIANKLRSEPANLLLVAGKPWLVDCGDGAMEQLAKAGFQARQIDYVFISHLHLDHTGGLQGFIGLRWMTGAQTLVTIYGPPGIQQLVDGIVQSLQPSVRISANEPMKGMPPAQMVKVVTVQNSSSQQVAGVEVRTARNSHFDSAAGKPLDNGSQSLSYRFDHGGRVIVYTGDTGPSPAVTQLGQGADLLVSEVIDLATMTQALKNTPGMPSMPEAGNQEMIDHFVRQHISPREVGKMATTAGVKKVVFTHLSILPTATVAAIGPKLIAEAHETFKGDVVVAQDLDQF